MYKGLDRSAGIIGGGCGQAGCNIPQLQMLFRNYLVF